MNDQASRTMYNETHYILNGAVDNPKVVCFVHGVGCYHSCFNGVAKALQLEGYTTLNYDLIGRGFSSEHSNGLYGAAEHLDQLEGLIKHIGFKYPINIIAHSMGGSLAALFVAKNKDLVKSLVLLSPAGLMDLGALSLVRNLKCLQGAVKGSLKPRKNQEKAWRDCFHNHKGEFKQLEDEMVKDMHEMYNHNPNAFNAFWKSVLQFPLSGIDTQVSQLASNPNLNIYLIFTKKDKAVPFKPNFHRWKHLLENKACHFQYHIIDNVGHAFMQEKPQETEADIVQYLNTVNNSNGNNNTNKVVDTSTNNVL